jgi:hypothetical protein
MKWKLVLVLLSLSAGFLWAEFEDIPLTRDLHSDGNYHDIADYLHNHPEQPTVVQERYRSSHSPLDNESILVVVQGDLYPQISESIDTYIDDLEDEGNSVYLLQFSGTSALDLRYQLMYYYQIEAITGAVLVGDLPVAVFELFEDFNNNGIWDPDENWVDFPCDLFYSDVDGNWEDTDANGYYDVHDGDMHPELFIGRIKAENLPLLGQSEASLLNAYFWRTHLYHRGLINFPSRALGYIDDDWAPWGPEFQAALQLLYDDVDLIHDENETRADDYRDVQLHQGYEFIQVHVHSGPDAHYFYENNGNDYNLVTNTEIASIMPDALFYNLFCCSNSRFTTANNMGGLYVYGNESCFATIGSTKTGSMLRFEDFYQPLGAGENLGNALRLWWEQNVDASGDWMWERSWFYGMVIQGDPTLRLQAYNDVVACVPAEFTTIQAAIDVAEDGDVVLVEPGTYHENIDFLGKDITVTSRYFITHDPSYIGQTIIDGNQAGSVVTCASGESDQAVLSGFSLINGSALSTGGCGGGVYVANASPRLEHLFVNENQAQRGGGIYLDGCDVIRMTGVDVANNNASDMGAGFFAHGCNDLEVFDSVFQDNASAGNGGNVYLEDTSIDFSFSTLLAGNAFSYGGALYCDASDVNFEHCELSENNASSGAAIHGENSTVSLNSCRIVGNGSETGAIACGSTVLTRFTNCLITDNAVFEGFALTAPAVVIHSVFYNNTAQSPVNPLFSGVDVMINSIAWNNAQPLFGPDAMVQYCCVEGGWAGTGNIASDPQFLLPGFDLFSLRDSSVCIGAGIDAVTINGEPYAAPTHDMQGNPRPFPLGSMPDMGVIEHALGAPLVSAEELEAHPPRGFVCNSPNPFNPSTTIRFSIATHASDVVSVDIYNSKGQKVQELVTQMEAGLGSVHWDGDDATGKPVSSGVYFCRIQADTTTLTHKMVMMK